MGAFYYEEASISKRNHWMEAKNVCNQSNYRINRNQRFYRGTIMASTKYRKRAKTESSPIERSKHENDERGADREVLDTPRSEILPPRNAREETKIEPIYPKEEKAQAPSPSEDKVIDIIRIDDGKNVFEMRLIKQANRLMRINHYFNNIEVRPHNYGGSSSGQDFMNLLKMTSKKGNQ